MTIVFQIKRSIVTGFLISLHNRPIHKIYDKYVKDFLEARYLFLLICTTKEISTLGDSVLEDLMFKISEGSDQN